MRIGIDLDNTLICYDRAFLEVGKDEGLLPASFEGDKVAVKRTLLARRPDGLLWETLQGLVYGRRIDAASLFDGVTDFLELCRQHGSAVAIVSHKTERAHHDPFATDLRQAALNWMERRGFFNPGSLGIERDSVYFEATRDDKVRRIDALGCELFVDDLADVLSHGGMPRGCRKILFGGEPTSGLEHCSTWREVRDAVFPTA